ncbi:N-acetylmuramoyl-L-alanine amidase [Catenuloplanes niger JCM 9533]
MLPALTAVALGAGGVGVAAGPTDPAVQQLELAVARDGGTVTLPPRTVRPFSLVGVTWPDPAQSIAGTAEVRTRTRSTWSGWRALDVDQHFGADADQPEAEGVRGGTDPLWVGEADGVELRIRALGRAPLPAGLRLELVNPGPATGSGPASDGAGPRMATPPGPTPPGPTPPAAAPQRPAGAPRAAAAVATVPVPLVGAPAMVDRAAWKADERINRGAILYTGPPQVMFVHHTAGTNDYTCAQSPALVRAIHAYHVKSRKWGDIGYNFVVDKCGTVFEGRRGGAELSVLGAHTYGFNTDSFGVVVLGTYSTRAASAAALRSLAHLAAWKLGAEAADTGAQVLLESRADNRYRVGNQVIFHRVSAHRDGVLTECPGNALYRQIPEVRRQAAELVRKALK